MIVPFETIAASTLQNLIEEFVTREGTDYGEVDFSLQDKVSAITQRLRSGELVILYIDSTESVNIVERQSLNGQ